ncbi:MAG: polyprenyl synthetase family protein [bacterium]
MRIEEIYAPIENKLSLVKERLKIKEDDNEALSEILSYIQETRGKLIRPALFLFSTTLNGDSSVNLASSIELIHCASLLHDDIIDCSNLRRNKETIVSKWGKNWALLVGDLFLASAFNILVDYGDMRIVKLFAKGCLLMCRGQMSELERGIKMDEERYLKIIYQKTAHLFELSCLTGAMVGNNDLKSLSNYGRNLGLAFQIIDDMLDIEGDDVKNKKATLPIIHTMKMASPADKAMLDKLIIESNANGIRDMVKKYEGIEYAKGIAKEYAEKAKSSIADTSLTHKESLLSLSEFVLYRNE